MSRLVRSTFAIGWVTVGLSACGGTSTDTPPFSSGVPRERDLGKLASAERSTLCAELEGYVSSTQEDAFCGLLGRLGAELHAASSSDADLQKSCSEAEEQCRRDAASGRANVECLAIVDSSCTATVGDYEDCKTEQFSELRQAAAGFPACSELTKSSLDAHQKIAVGAGPACQRLAAKCPAAVEDESREGAPPPGPESP